MTSAAYADRALRIIDSLAAAKRDARLKGFGKGKPGASNCQCPICKGTLDYSVARDGMMRGKCQTEGCAEWEE